LPERHALTKLQLPLIRNLGVAVVRSEVQLSFSVSVSFSAGVMNSSDLETHENRRIDIIQSKFLFVFLA